MHAYMSSDYLECMHGYLCICSYVYGIYMFIMSILDGTTKCMANVKVFVFMFVRTSNVHFFPIQTGEQATGVNSTG